MRANAVIDVAALQLVLPFLVCAQIACAASVCSPDGAITASVHLADGRLTYSASRAGTSVLRDAPLGIALAGAKATPLSLGSNGTYAIDETYATRGMHSVAINRCNGAVIAVRDARNQTCWLLDVRVFNDGLAFRYVVPGSGTRTVSGETTGVCVPADSTAWFQGENCAYESPHEEMSVGAIAWSKFGWLISATPPACRRAKCPTTMPPRR